MKSERVIRLVIIATGLFLGITACTTVDEAEYIATENRYFDLFMNANYPDLQPLESGLYYINEKEGTGISADSGDYVLLNYVAWLLPSKTIFDTYVESIAEDNDLYTDVVLYGPLKYEHGNEIPGLKEGVSLMKEGGVSTLIFKSELGYGSSGYGDVDPYTSLMYDIELVKVIKDVRAYEDEVIASILDTLTSPYVAITYQDTITMYYVERTAGTGDQIDTTDVVNAYYTGYLPDGRLFDTNVDDDPLEVDLADDVVILGWQLGLPYFKFGGTGTLIIPYPLAYGEDGATESTTGKVSMPPYQTLIFDITIEEEDAK